MVQNIAIISRNMLYNILTLSVSLFIAWHLLLAGDFFYGFWHDHIGIAENIRQYGPENIYRTGFADTTRAQRIELFSQICHSISHQGAGLADIRYSIPEKGINSPLLHQAEIIHLQDVANLISTLQKGEPLLYLVWAALLATFIAKAWRLPSWRQLLLANAFWIGAVTILIMVVGWVSVFYKLHTLIFPDKHQWFFYYHESLMSTMMQAPDLFLYIGLSLAVLSGLLYGCLHLLARLLSRYQVQASRMMGSSQ
ncbi:MULTISPECIES: DUF1461 domain-containing protein [Zhongshania]|jgi:hypothetical protein|uniref:DUF1461 domain-containing protein n=1 Tax=Zhongshania antarctica TaxID=641702 RepID=A0A840R4L9_9GAMM|nr:MULTISPECIES: DUF1461 domain-containing protein [Zhongshania]MBB5187548.1 hypothetical protein [Zhongshania antarctica]